MEGGTGIPASARGSHRAHLDTAYLIPFLLGRDAGTGTDRDLYERAYALLEQGHPVGVSTVAVGEAFVKLATDFAGLPRDGANSPSTRFFQLARNGKLEVCWLDNHKPRGRIFIVAEEVRKGASGVGGTDALIVASAILCHQRCAKLYSPDRVLQTDAWLRRHYHELSIEDAPRPAVRRGG